MRLDVNQLTALALLSSALHWLIARSEIMRPLWSRARGKLADLLACAGCSGWWIGLGLGLGGLQPITDASIVVNVLTSGLFGVFLTPVAEGVLLWGLAVSAIEREGADAVATLPETPSSGAVAAPPPSET